MTARRHPSIQATAADPCPFCGSGGIALAKVRAPRSTGRRFRFSEDRSAFPSLFSDHPRSLPDYYGAAAERIGADARATFASWAAHAAAGEYPVITDGRTAVAWRTAA